MMEFQHSLPRADRIPQPVPDGHQGRGRHEFDLRRIQALVRPHPPAPAGALVADRPGRVTTYAVLAMADRGELFVEVGDPVYAGMIVGERNRNGDLAINITKEKKLANMRSSTSEATVTLRPPRPFSLDQCIEFIAEDELVEVTPENIRLRKMELDANKRLAIFRRGTQVDME